MANYTEEQRNARKIELMEKCYNGLADLGLHGTGIPYQKLTALSFILIRACVHYALFEDEFYLKAQIEVLKESLELFMTKYNPEARSGAMPE